MQEVTKGGTKGVPLHFMRWVPTHDTLWVMGQHPLYALMGAYGVLCTDDTPCVYITCMYIHVLHLHCSACMYTCALCICIYIYTYMHALHVHIWTPICPYIILWCLIWHVKMTKSHDRSSIWTSQDVMMGRPSWDV